MNVTSAGPDSSSVMSNGFMDNMTNCSSDSPVDTLVGFNVSSVSLNMSSVSSLMGFHMLHHLFVNSFSHLVGFFIMSLHVLKVLVDSFFNVLSSMLSEMLLSVLLNVGFSGSNVFSDSSTVGSGCLYVSSTNLVGFSNLTSDLVMMFPHLFNVLHHLFVMGMHLDMVFLGKSSQSFYMLDYSLDVFAVFLGANVVLLGNSFQRFDASGYILEDLVDSVILVPLNVVLFGNSLQVLMVLH